MYSFSYFLQNYQTYRNSAIPPSFFSLFSRMPRPKVAVRKGRWRENEGGRRGRREVGGERGEGGLGYGEELDFEDEGGATGDAGDGAGTVAEFGGDVDLPFVAGMHLLHGDDPTLDEVA